jgi:hypothetical protein
MTVVCPCVENSQMVYLVLALGVLSPSVTTNKRKGHCFLCETAEKFLANVVVDVVTRWSALAPPTSTVDRYSTEYQIIIDMDRPIRGISHHVGRVNYTSEVRLQTDSKYIIYRLDSLIMVGDGCITVRFIIARIKTTFFYAQFSANGSTHLR